MPEHDTRTEIERAVAALESGIAGDLHKDEAVAQAQLRLSFVFRASTDEQTRLVNEAKTVMNRYQDWLAEGEALPEARDLLRQALAA